LFIIARLDACDERNVPNGHAAQDSTANDENTKGEETESDECAGHISSGALTSWRKELKEDEGASRGGNEEEGEKGQPDTAQL
jgi:hypothetical protein